jgi:phospholipase A1
MSKRWGDGLGAVGLMASLAGAGAVSAQTTPAEPLTWQACAAVLAPADRLACYDRWAQVQTMGGAATAPAAEAAAHDRAQAAADPLPAPPEQDGCRDQRHGFSDRFWELSQKTDCGTLRLRGHRPLSLALSVADQVNTQATSPAERRSASAPTDYSGTEMRVALSVRTKIATGFLPTLDPQAKDSLWFAYSQQSHWQLFSPSISRPFRNTDHEPELIYVYPLDGELPGGGRLRYAGLAAVHYSNGQSEPLSRSWNRSYAMVGAEWGERWALQAKAWTRVPEKAGDDDNPDISDRYGRMEWRLLWQVNPRHTLGLTTRHNLSRGPGGSVSVDWYRTLSADPRSQLRLHARWFSGYGESLIDYNFRRNSLSLGLSLLDY